MNKGGIMGNINSLIDNDMLKSLVGCVGIVEICTESVKYLLKDVNGAWVAFIFSIIVSLVSFLLGDDYSKKTLILTILNIFPIFLCSVGIYEIGIEPIKTRGINDV